MSSIFDNVYNIIFTFFPSDLVSIPFFEFLINLLMFSFCSLLFAIFFIFPTVYVFLWLKNKMR